MSHFNINSPQEMYRLLDQVNHSHRKHLGTNPAARLIKCPICAHKRTDGKIWRYTNGVWGRCTVCGFKGYNISIPTVK